MEVTEESLLARQQQLLDTPLLTLTSSMVEALEDNGTKLFRLRRKAGTKRSSMAVQLRSDVAAGRQVELMELSRWLSLLVGLQERHWDQITAAVGKEDVRPTPSERSGAYLDAHLDQLKRVQYKIEEMAMTAAREATISHRLDRFEKDWSDDGAPRLRFCHPRRNPDLTEPPTVLRGFDDVLQLADNQLSEAQACSFSAYCTPANGLAQRAAEWARRIRLLQELIDECCRTQADWLAVRDLFHACAEGDGDDGGADGGEGHRR